MIGWGETGQQRNSLGDLVSEMGHKKGASDLGENALRLVLHILNFMISVGASNYLYSADIWVKECEVRGTAWDRDAHLIATNIEVTVNTSRMNETSSREHVRRRGFGKNPRKLQH